MWEALGTRPEDVEGYEWADEPIDASELVGIADASVPLLAATFEYSMHPDEARIDAYDLDDGFYYIVERDEGGEVNLRGVPQRIIPRAPSTRPMRVPSKPTACWRQTE